jgi:hypothetical protein
MRGAGRPIRTVRPAAVVAALLLAGLLPGTDRAVGQQQAKLRLTYTCRFPPGTPPSTASEADPASADPAAASTVRTEAVLDQDFPAIGAVGADIQPGPLTVALSLPRSAVTAVLPEGTAAVGGTADLTARVEQGTSTADADWPGLVAAPTDVSGTGDPVLVLTGVVTPVTVASAGDVVFMAGDLALELRPEKADGSAAEPAAPKASCSPDAGQDTRLGTVPVPPATPATAPPPATSAGGPSAPASAAPDPIPAPSAPAAAGGAPGSPGSPAGGLSASPRTGGGRDGTSGKGAVRVAEPIHSGVHDCPPAPTDPPAADRLPKVPEGAFVFPPPGSPPPPVTNGCGYAIGYSNVHKLGSAAIINDPRHNPALVRVNMGVRKVFLLAPQPGQEPYIEVDSVAELTLPPADSTFLTYGFMPTTAKMELIPQGPLTIVQTGYPFFDQPTLSTISGYQSLRLYDVRINGTPLDVGPDCRTSAPLDVVLRGRQDGYLPGGGDGKLDYTVQTGGPLAAENLTIPPFTGCGTGGEDLDPLFTAAVSGPGNSLNFIQGALCVPSGDQPNGCEPEIEIPPLPHR